MRIRAGPIFILQAPGDSATIDPCGKDIPAVRRTTAQPVGVIHVVSSTLVPGS